MEKKIALIEVWLGKIPPYFKYHIETISQISCVDFYFFTDDIEYDFSDIKIKNFFYKYITEKEFLDRFNNSSKIKIDKISHPKKIIDFKLSYFRMFSNYVDGYDYVGIYDIDTLFGNINQALLSYIGRFDFISVGDEIFHNRLSGPLMIVRNTEEFHNLMETDRYYETLQMEDIYGYGEQELSNIAMSEYKTKIIYSMNTETSNGGKNTYDVQWSGGRLVSNGQEISLYHFIKKNHTSFQKIGNKIFGRYDKKFIEDFYWVFGFTENYSQTVYFLLDSMHKYSNRKCIVYSINFDYQIPDKFLTSSQFIFRRIDIEEGKKDFRGRDENIISCKPKMMIDVIDSFPDKKFIFIDSDVYLTTSADDISKHFRVLENYPLINSHIHDRLYLCGIRPGEEWTDTVSVLAKAADVDICVYPRRKTNIMLFDERSRWFFEEQIDLYEKYKETEPGIFVLHDEDSANVVLSKYNLQGCLPLCDIEECSNLDMSKFTDLNHPFHMTGISEFVILPQHQNDIIFFHGLKENERYVKIQQDYGNSVLDCEEILVKYENNTLLFEKNSFLTTKKIDKIVNFVVKNESGNILYSLNDQDIFQYWVFFISDIILEKGKYIIEIFESRSNIKVYNNLLEIL